MTKFFQKQPEEVKEPPTKKPKIISEQKMTPDGTMKKTSFKVKPCGKFFLHHKSHLNDPTLQPRKLDATENIFDIIMPWLPDQRKEEEEKAKEQCKLGIITEKEFKAIQKRIQAQNKSTMDQKSAFGFNSEANTVDKGGFKQSKLTPGGGVKQEASQRSGSVKSD